jgi:hypothetical protein
MYKPTTDLEKLVDNLRDRRWNFYELGKNPNITYDFIRTNPKKRWRLEHVLRNPNISRNDKIKFSSDKCKYNEYAMINSTNLTWDDIAASGFRGRMGFASSYLPYDGLLPGCKFIRRFLAENPTLPIEVVLSETDHQWYWKKLGKNPIITLEYMEIVKEIYGEDVMESLSQNPNLTPKFILDHLDWEWNWNEIAEFVYIKLGELKLFPKINIDMYCKNIGVKYHIVDILAGKYGEISVCGVNNLSNNPNVGAKMLKKYFKGCDCSTNPNITYRHITDNIKYLDVHCISKNYF